MATRFETRHFQAVIDLIEANTPVAQQDLGPFSRELKKRILAFYREVSENLTDLSPTESRHYRDYLLKPLPELQFYRYEEIAAAWMAIKTYEFTAEQVEMNTSFIEDMAKEGYSICPENEIGEVRHAKMFATIQVSELFWDWVEEVTEFIEDHYEFIRRTHFIGQLPEAYISEDLLRDFETLFLEKLSEEGIRTLNSASLPELELLFARLRVDEKNFSEEYHGNFYGQKADISIPYLEQLLPSLLAARERWEHFPVSGTTTDKELWDEKGSKLRRELREFVVRQLDNHISSKGIDLEEQREWPFMLDIHNPDSLSHDHKIHRELIVFEPGMADRFAEDPEELIEELSERLGISIPVLEARLPVILDEKRWTYEDGLDNGLMWEYATREFWETNFKEY